MVPWPEAGAHYVIARTLAVEAKKVNFVKMKKKEKNETNLAGIEG